MNLYPHTYRVTSVPDGCDQYEHGQEVTMWVPEPAPATLILSGEHPCNGTTMELVD